MQGVLPTMIILAVYYTLADIVLLGQCFWYKGFTLKDEVHKPADSTVARGENGLENGNGQSIGHTATERSPLLASQTAPMGNGTRRSDSSGQRTRPTISDIDRRHSAQSTNSLRERLLSMDGTHLSPVTPFLQDSPFADTAVRNAPERPRPQSSVLQTVLFNLGAVVLVCASGVFGWYLSASRAARTQPPHDDHPSNLHFNTLGQIFGYICALLYLGSRIPQLLLNYRRKSTEGISMLFFLFACIGNLTYVLSILAYKPVCRIPGECQSGEKERVYWRWLAVNASWLLGSLGTLVLDAGVFVQYFMYRADEEGNDASDEE